MAGLISLGVIASGAELTIQLPLEVNSFKQDAGAEIEVAATTKSQLSFWVMDMSYGLATKTPVRPENLIGSSNSDATFVCRKYTL